MITTYSKREYRRWEEKVVQRFWDPTVAVKKVKVLVVCDVPLVRPDGVVYIPMYHIGKRGADLVKAGTSDGTVFYPATDTGGLTNYRVREGDAPRFSGTRMNPDDAKGVYREWRRLSGKKKFFGGVFEGLRRWLSSCPAGSVIRFHRLPTEKRVLVKAEDVKRLMGGIYMTRLFGRGDASYAEVPPDVEGLYASVSDSFVTPNVNRNNKLNEYE